MFKCPECGNTDRFDIEYADITHYLSQRHPETSRYNKNNATILSIMCQVCGRYADGNDDVPDFWIMETDEEDP